MDSASVCVLIYRPRDRAIARKGVDEQKVFEPRVFQPVVNDFLNQLLRHGILPRRALIGTLLFVATRVCERRARVRAGASGSQVELRQSREEIGPFLIQKIITAVRRGAVFGVPLVRGVSGLEQRDCVALPQQAVEWILEDKIEVTLSSSWLRSRPSLLFAPHFMQPPGASRIPQSRRPSVSCHEHNRCLRWAAKRRKRCSKASACDVSTRREYPPMK